MIAVHIWGGSNVSLSGSWDSWASYFLSILILLEILTLPLHPHFLLASLLPPLPPLTHIHTQSLSRTHTHTHTPACTRGTHIPSLLPSLTLSHRYMELADWSVCASVCVRACVCACERVGEVTGFVRDSEIRVRKKREMEGWRPESVKEGERKGGEETWIEGKEKEMAGDHLCSMEGKCACVCVCVVFNCWIVCAPGGLVCTRECERTSELSSFFFKPSLFFIFPLFAALCVCDNSPAETKGEVLYRCCC